MIKIKYSVRPFIKSNGQVAIKVRWNSKQCEVTFITGVYADPCKWDEDSHKAKRGTIHTVRSMSFEASEINERIADFKDEIDSAFSKCSLRNIIPTSDELKTMVNKALGRTKEIKEETTIVKKKTMEQMIKWFLEECGKEKNWDDQAKEKYTQAEPYDFFVNSKEIHIMNPKTVEQISYLLKYLKENGEEKALKYYKSLYKQNKNLL